MARHRANLRQSLLILLLCFNISLNYPFYPYSDTSAPEIPQGTSNGVSFKLVGQVGGPTQAVAVKDNHAYAGIGMRMVVLDVSSPSSIQQVGETSVFDEFVTGVAISGTTACVTAGVAGLYTVDISSPTQPSVLGSCDTSGYAENVFLKGGYAYVADAFKGLTVIDVSSPSSPSELGVYEVDGHAGRVVITGNKAYVADRYNGLRIVDVSNASNPTPVGLYSPLGYAREVAVSGNYACVAGGPCGLRMVDVSNPAHPSELGRIDSQGQVFEIEVDGNTAYVANGSSGILAVDFTNPSSLSLIGEFNTPGFSHKLQKVGNLLYVADADAGLIILEMQQATGSSQSNLRHKNYSQINYPSSGIGLPVHEHRIRILPKNLKKQYPRLTPQTVVNKLGISTAWVVTTTADSGEGSLRWCMENAQNGDTITFNTSVFPPDNPAAITLSSQLPTLNKGYVTVDASNAGVIIDGKNLSGNVSGIDIDSNGNVVMGLQILYFPSNGVGIHHGEENIIGGDRTKGNGPVGQGNVISGNGNHGISMGNKISSGNSIIGNYIGTDISGSYSLGNTSCGVVIELGSYNNLVKGNLINGSGWNGILISDWGSSYNTVVGNIIGLDSNGQKALGNDGAGVVIGWTCFNRVGGTSPEERNVVSGHPYRDGVHPSGVDIYGPSARDNFIMGNFIGTDLTGTKAVPNNNGLSIGSGSGHNFIGGTTEEERNVISGNDVNLGVGRGDHNFMAGNYIGVSAEGTSTLPSMYAGISIDNKTFHTAICGNLIYGDPGIDLYGDENILRGNTITQSNRGLQISGNNNVIHYNKFLNNQTQASDSGSNSWDKDGAGNYWSDYTGSDSDGDGIGDTSYSIPDKGTDNHPLMHESNRLTVQVNPSGGGSVTITPNESSYEYGENVRLEALIQIVAIFNKKSPLEFLFWGQGRLRYFLLF